MVPELTQSGVRLIAIGNGTPLMAQDFLEKFSVPFPLYTDPSRSSYKKMGFKKKLGINISSLKRTKEALSAGHKQGKVQGDPFQQGGEALFNKGGDLIWSRPSSAAGDHANHQEIRTALKLLPS
jgi:hypothetical protein